MCDDIVVASDEFELPISTEEIRLGLREELEFTEACELQNQTVVFERHNQVPIPPRLNRRMISYCVPTASSNAVRKGSVGIGAGEVPTPVPHIRQNAASIGREALHDGHRRFGTVIGTGATETPPH